MNLEALTSIRDLAWLYAAGPLLLIAALLLTARLKAPQWRRLPDAFRALRTPGEEEGTAPGLAAALAATATFGAAGVVGAATAVSLGGPGTLPYLWLFGILLAPIYYAQTLFAKTDAPGRGDAAASGSVSRRLLRMGGGWRFLGGAVLVALLAAACLWGGAVHGAALMETTQELLPGSTPVLVGAAAALGTLLAVSEEKTAGLAGWLALAGLTVLMVAALWGIAADPGLAFGALADSFTGALEGSPQAGDFTGALAGEVAFAATLHLLPAGASGVGVAGSLESISRGRVRVQAALALLTPLVFAVFATVLVMASVGTGAFSTKVQGERSLLDARFYTVPAGTANERIDEARLYDGYVRIRDGQPRNPHLLVGSERGMISEPRYEYNGRTADIALQVREGAAFRLMRNSGPETLGDVDATNLWRASVVGEMVPTGGTLAVATARTAGGDLAARILLAALLALAAVAFAGFGLGAGRALPASVPMAAKMGVALLPGVGVALVLTGVLPGIPLLGQVAMAVLVALVALALILRSTELAKLDADLQKKADKAAKKRKKQKKADSDGD
ncbi:MAG: hypothetical protein JJ863_38090 [Deltaproteobacteria bacterium]|nr:hypothetical protein [Deltaproteobacteria bacterium]